jgi:outer membrane protein OmpA-like peptidoglycan-associated protein
MWLSLAGIAAAQSLVGPDPVGFAPVAPAGPLGPLRVVTAGGAGAAGALGVASTDAPTATAGSGWAWVRSPLGEDAAVAVVAGGHGGEGSAGLGTVALHAPIRHATWRGVSLGTAPFFELPVGGAWGGPVSAGLRSLASVALGDLVVDANLGGRLAPGGTAEGVSTGSAALVGAALTVPLDGPTVVVEHDAALGVGPASATTTLSLRGELGGWGLLAGGAVGWTDAPGVSRFRGFAGVTHPLPHRRPPPPPAPVPVAAPPPEPPSVQVVARGFLDLPVLDAAVTVSVPAAWSPGATYGVEIRHPKYRPLSLPRLPLAPGPTTLVVAIEPLPGQLLVTATDGRGGPRDARINLSPPVVPPFELGPDGRETVRLPPGQYALVAGTAGASAEERRVVVGPAEPVEVDLVLHDAALRFVDGALREPGPGLFVGDGDELSEDGRGRLAELAAYLREHPEVERLVIAVTLGGVDGPEALHRSQRRADNVAGWLFGHGVDRGRLDPRGRGAGGADEVEFRVTAAPR